MADSVQARFEKAVKYVREAPPSADSTNEMKLALYALYKQATEGDVQGAQPWAVQFEARAKYDAWAAEKGLSKEAAQQKYVDTLTSQSPSWENWGQ